jgi:hypothetical protein
MQFDTKIAVVGRDDLAVWQRLNVVAFLAGGLAGSSPENVGRPHEDGAGPGYLPLIGQPILVYVADAADMRRAFERARSRGIVPAIYTKELSQRGTTRTTGPRSKRSGSKTSTWSASRCAIRGKPSTRRSTDSRSIRSFQGPIVIWRGVRLRSQD